jgi:hypothetical protein
MNVEEARRYAANRDKKISLAYMGQSLKALAAAGDGENFCRVVDKYKKAAASGDGPPMDFVDWICASVDNGFANLTYGPWPRAMGTTQAFFRELYENRGNNNETRTR